jgi:hypothetical protein
MVLTSKGVARTRTDCRRLHGLQPEAFCAEG